MLKVELTPRAQAASRTCVSGADCRFNVEQNLRSAGVRGHGCARIKAAERTQVRSGASRPGCASPSCRMIFIPGKSLPTRSSAFPPS